MSARATVIALADSDEPLLLRAQLEALSLDVQLNRIGRPSDVFSAFSFYGERADFIVLSAHGDEKGIIVPEMAPGVDPVSLPGNRIGPSELRAHLQSVEGAVLSTACSTGHDGFADPFIARGASAYIAPAGDPDGRDIALFVHGFAHGLFRAGLDIEAALARANALLAREDQFELWR